MQLEFWNLEILEHRKQDWDRIVGRGGVILLEKRLYKERVLGMSLPVEAVLSSG